MSFKFVDLFAGIGGFHGALSSLGGECVYASEIDKDAVRIYERNWGLLPKGDITLDANDRSMNVPPHDVLVAGFPCQPFSKSGKQLGMEEARGTLFYNIAKIIEAREPSMVLLENVRNLAGPRHAHEWQVIICTLRDLGYRVSSVPLVVSPHRIRPEFGGRPQVRERVLIAATRDRTTRGYLVEEPSALDLEVIQRDWNPVDWNIKKDLPLSIPSSRERKKLSLSTSETRWIEAWNDFVVRMRKALCGKPLPGFPIWVDSWIDLASLSIEPDTPKWKAAFLTKNAVFYTEYRELLDSWLKQWEYLADFPASRRKFEWQAQDEVDLWSTVMHFRPSGIRAKRATYVPAMVAITQTSIYGPQRRRLSVREGARLQGFPDWFDFGDQSDSTSYKQLGNAVNVAVIYNVLRAQALRDVDLLGHRPDIIRSILGASPNPDVSLNRAVEAASCLTLDVENSEHFEWDGLLRA